MANRFFNQFHKSLEKEPVSIYARVSFGASGAPTLDAVNSKGVVSVTRNSAGTYTFVFGTKAGMLDVYNRLLHCQAIFNTAGASGAVPAAPMIYVKADSVATVNTSLLQIVCINADTPAATDPASGEVGLFRFIFKNSNAP